MDLTHMVPGLTLPPLEAVTVCGAAWFLQPGLEKCKAELTFLAVLWLFPLKIAWQHGLLDGPGI